MSSGNAFAETIGGVVVVLGFGSVLFGYSIFPDSDDASNDGISLKQKAINACERRYDREAGDARAGVRFGPPSALKQDDGTWSVRINAAVGSTDVSAKCTVDDGLVRKFNFVN